MPQPVIGAQLSVLDLDKNRNWLLEADRDLELPEFCMADILRNPDTFIDMALDKLDGWNGRLGIHGPFSGFELDVKDRDMRIVVQTRIDQALAVCERLGATQMVLHSPYDHWDHCNLDNAKKNRTSRVAAILDTLAPALDRAENQGVVMVLENIKDVSPMDRLSVVQAADSPALKISVDVGHAHWAHKNTGAPPADRFISMAGEKLAHVHLQDSDGRADRHWPLGQGDVGFHAIFRALASIKAQPHLIVEINEFDKVQASVAHLAKLGLGQ